MKKKLLYLFSAVTLFGCQIEVEVPESPDVCLEVPSDYVASTEVSTKTSLDETFNVLWTKDDRISVFDHTTINGEYKIADDCAGKSTASLVRIVSSDYVAETDLSANVAYYPYDKNIKASQTGDVYTLSVNLPASQAYAANSFGIGASPIAAVTESKEGKDLSFKNVCGVLKLQLTGSDKIRKIELKGNNGEPLAGAASVSVKFGENPSIAMSGSETVLTLDCGESGVQLNSDTPTSFCIVVPPMTFSKGFTAKVYDVEGGTLEISTSKSQTVNRSTILKMPKKSYEVGPSYVDLGLSVKWATCNVGATKPEEYGEYYAWGETEEKSYYDWSSYKWCKGSSNTMTKYCTDSSYGTVDNKSVLEPDDDVAHVKLGGSWRMPTIEEWTELRKTNNCSWTWTENYDGTGVSGYIVSSKKSGYTDRSIFLPAAGYRYDASLVGAGSDGEYWSSSLRTDISSSARYLGFTSDYALTRSCSRYYGQSVRPVSE